MKPASDQEEERRRIYDAIGTFLFDHRLEPTPANYMLVHTLVTGSNASAIAAIEDATSDGLRLTQMEANRILGSAGIEIGAPSIGPETIDHARRQVDDFTDIVEATQAEVRTYSGDLETGAAQLEALDGPDSLGDLVRITGAMIERTREAEKRLENATIEARALRERLASAEEEARRDALTALPNRRAFEDRYAALVDAGVPVSVALCDVDHFKLINDSHGHGVGDRVLKMVASVLDANCPGHMVARYGGEEFAVVFAAVGAAAASRIIGEAREAVANRYFKVRETDAPLGAITFSAGVVAAGKDEDVESVMKRADALLYKAKDRGRNRVEVDTARGPRPSASPKGEAVSA